MVSKGEEKKDINRAIFVTIFALIISLFLIFNSPEKFNAGTLYSIMGVMIILAYLSWNKF